MLRRPRRVGDENPTASDEINAGAPSARGGGGGTSATEAEKRGLKPLGVPKDYTATVGRMWTPSPGRSGRVERDALRYLAEQGPRYFQGDEWRPASYGPDSIAERQRALVLAGYIGAQDRFRLGAWDATTRKAYKALLEDSNAAGVTEDQMIRMRAQGMEVGVGPGGAGGGTDGGGGGGGGGTYIDPVTGELVEAPYQAPPLELKLPNKQDVRSVFRSAIIDKLGEGWSQEQIDAMADQYINQVRQLQVDAYQQEVARDRDLFETGTTKRNTITSIDAPSAETFVEDQLMKTHPVEAQAQGVVDLFFENMGQFWQSPLGGG